MLSVKDLSIQFRDFKMENVSFDVRQGDYQVIVGPSGSGKSLLLEMIAGITRPKHGKIFLDSADITQTKIQKRPIGLVYQDQALFPHLNVRKNIEYGLKSRGASKEYIDQRLQTISKKVGIDHIMHRAPGTLSGGESQRVALARTLITAPRCILLDEPLSSLDSDSKRDLISFLKDLNSSGHTFIHVTHDLETVKDLATNILIMENGRIKQG